MTEQTALDLPAIRSLHAGITPGPWFANRYYVAAGEDQSDPDDEIARASFKADAAFIAAAPSIVTQLLAVVDAQQAKLDAVVALADTPDQTLVKPKGDKIFYVEAHRIRAALIGEGQ